MQRKRVVQGLVGLVFIVVMLAVPLAVLADRPATGAVAPVSAGVTRLELGNVCANSTVTGTTLVAMEREGTTAFANNGTVTISVLGTSVSALSATIGEPDTITLPSDWVARASGTVSDGYVVSTVTLMTGSPGTAFLGTVSYLASGPTPAGGSTTTRGVMGVSANVIDCSKDTTAPTATIRTPAAGAVYQINEVVLADYACEDEEGGTGIKTCVGTVLNDDPIDTSSVGSKSFIVTAKDTAGNVTEETHTYTVIAPDPEAYSFAGFLRPVAEGWNVTRAGAAVSIKFSLGGDWGLGVLASAVSAPIACEESTTLNQVVEEAALTPGQSILSYDAESDQYNYVWKTQRSWADTCRVFELTLDDGTTHTAKFAFR